MRLALFIFTLLAAVLFLSGCDQKASAPADAGEAHEVELFHENKGVQLPPEVRRNLDVATAEATEVNFTSIVQKSAHVYRAAAAGTPAAAVVWLSATEVAEIGGQPAIHIVRTGNAAKLVRIESASTSSTSQSEVLVEFADAGEAYPVGASVNVVFTSTRSRKALGVPASSIIQGVAGTFVYVANGEHFIRTPVKLGAATVDSVEVKDGLYEGDLVVAKAPDSLWLIELCALKGGTPCCPVPTKGSPGKKESHD